jgi:anti-sigma regulatory factor (Ser/Thr protein kinase)
VAVAVAVSDVEMTVDVTDEGEGFDLGAVQQSPDDPDWFTRERGRGVFLMRSLMDLVESRLPDVPGEQRLRHRLRLSLRRA